MQIPGLDSRKVLDTGYGPDNRRVHVVCARHFRRLPVLSLHPAVSR